MVISKNWKLEQWILIMSDHTNLGCEITAKGCEEIRAYLEELQQLRCTLEQMQEIMSRMPERSV